jgi:very-short-patch-repair endonuclease
MDETIVEPAELPEEPRCVRIQSTLAGKVNLADFQNAIPVIRELTVANDTDADIKDLRLTVSSEPSFFKIKNWHIDHVGAGRDARINDLDLALDGPLLGRLTESEKATITFRLTAGLETSSELASFEATIELLPRNQWGGLSSVPDMVAAFVQPNEPSIERVLKKAAEVLHKAGKSGAINGYQEGPRRAWELASAIWTAIGSMGIDYALPPASFEQSGQKVRSPSQIADSGLGTCLDLALFVCAALEQAGLNPLLVFTEGHAFPGVWLKSEEFSTSVIDDVTALRKRVKLQEMVLFESTLLTQRPYPAFSFGIANGEEQIAEEKAKAFLLAVDIRRARLQRIKPLASEQAVSRGTVGTESANNESAFEDAPDLPEELDHSEAEKSVERPEDRLTRWQRKLLDLSLRNNLLSFKGGKKSLKLDAPDPGQLEDILAEGHAIKLLTRPDLMDGNDPRNQAIHESRERENIRRAHALDALKRKEVFVGLSEDEMDTRLVELFRSSRTSLQEGGSNTLFLALGFLSWTRESKDDKKYRAPLILVPVSLERRSARSGFSLRLHDDEGRFNPTLIEMLRQDFELELGIQDTELPKDDSGLDVSGIWKTVSSAIKDIKGWEVVEEVVLATFSFAKYLMWKDLTERTEQLKQNAVVRHLIDTPRDSYESTVEFPDARKLDVELEVKNTFCPLPADSSQLSAVVAGSKGKDFVLIGPPGTGKSQTISNLIAQCLAERKRALFVSEKMAALDVVYRRLADVGLGNFCLELHSSKARKTEVLEQLRTSWDASAAMAPDEWHAEAARLEGLRSQLNGYVERLHLRYPNGLSVYEAIGKVVAGSDLPVLQLGWPTARQHDSAAMRQLRETADLLDVHAKVMGEGQLTSNPLAHIAQTEWSPLWQAALLEAARAIGSVVSGFESAAQALIVAIGLPELTLDSKVRDGLRLLAATLPAASGHDWRFVLRPDAKTIAEGLRLAKPKVERRREVHSSLSTPRGNQVQEDLRLGIAQLTRYHELQAQLGQPWNETLRSRLASGIELLRQRQDLLSQLTLPYRDGISSTTVQELQQEWRELETSSWPMSMLRRRGLAKKLKELASGGGEPNIAGDIERLAKIDGLLTELKGLDDLSLPTSNAWAGLKTELDVARASLGFQTALEQARVRAAWEDVGFDPVGRGQCGDAARDDLLRMRELRQIDQVLNRLSSLGTETDGVWSGYQTELAVAKAYVIFQSALAAAASERSWEDEGFGAIERGQAGATAAQDLKKMREMVELDARLKEFDDLSAKTNGLWSGLQTKIDGIDPALSFFEALSGALAVIASSPEMLAAVKAPIGLLLGDSNVLLEPSGTIAGAGRLYADALHGLNEATTRFTAASGLATSDNATLSALLPAELVDRANAVLNTSNRLNAWCAWRKARAQALDLGLAPVVQSLERGAIRLGRVKDTFETDYCRWWLNAVVDTDEVLRTFVSAEHEKRIRDFRELDERFISLTQAWVRSQLSAGHPSPDRVSRGSEWGLLRYEMQKKTRHPPLRELMSQASGAVMRLTPCLLMSPLSIAQYLPAETANFDVVIFDEASQIPVWDAIGAMARAKQVIMVGDPKQLPPTSFFDRAESDIDDIDVETELESILEECIGANLPTMKLSWHYRSRHESLIAFSNHRYYDGDLVTFPSPVTNDRAMSFKHVAGGQYERGGARTNKPEAKALVADMVARLKSPGFRDSGLTIGVVTFNSEQQSLIEDLLDEERRKDPSIEPFFLETQLEPVFVKNLESVQGDERDIMYFSITYGPGVDGTMPMNFGPMNQQGGERRLNVAITRARQELRVFCSFRPEQMDLSRTQALGVRDLKHFLEFADRGARALGEAVSGSVGDFESPFEKAVSRALTEKGWTLHPQVGVSAFRIDLGVVDPDAPGRYLAGVECDGATYHRSATARDRDKLREQVLRGLGWEIVRIWSTDWWIDMPGTVEKIHLQLEALVSAQRANAEAAEEEAAALAKSAIAAASQGQSRDVNVPAVGEGHTAVAEGQGRDAVAVTFASNAAANPRLPATEGHFIEVDLTVAGYEVDSNVFFDDAYNPTLLRMIDHVVKVEGPVRDEVLSRRIARAHGWVRTGSKIQDRVVRLASQHYRSAFEDVGIFFWPQNDSAEGTVLFRRPSDGSARSVDEISLTELKALAMEMFRAGYDKESGLTAMAREIGLRKLSSTSKARLELAWPKPIDESSSGNA